MRQKRADNGFTMLEVLVAIFFMGIIITTLFGSFNLLSSRTQDVMQEMTTFDMAKACLNRITDDLQSIYVTLPPGYVTPDSRDEPDLFRVEGEPGDMSSTYPRLRFTSRAHLPLEQSTREGIAEIVYYVMPEIDGTNVLRRSDRLDFNTPFEEKAGDPVLCDHVKSLAFTYYNAEGGEQDSWDSESDVFDYATPGAIGIKIETGDEDASFLFETRVPLHAWREKPGTKTDEVYDTQKQLRDSPDNHSRPGRASGRWGGGA